MPEGRQGMVFGRTSEVHGRSRWLTRVDLEHRGFSQIGGLEVGRLEVGRPEVGRRLRPSRVGGRAAP